MSQSISVKRGRKNRKSAKEADESSDLPGKGSVLKEITGLYNLSAKALRDRFRTLFPEQSPPTNRDFLIRRIAYKLQAEAFGDISEQAKDTLARLKTELNPLKDLAKKPQPKAGKRASRRAPLPGTTIEKTYKGRLIRVAVLDKGFEYNGKPYRSLSAVAREVTGVHQSGFVFFQL